MSIRGELVPETLRHYVEPKLVELVYSGIQNDPFPTPQEAQVCFKLGGDEQFAFVPLYLVNKEEGTVKASLIGELNDEVLVSFPPTNFGQTRFYASIEALEEIVKEIIGDGG